MVKDTHTAAAVTTIRRHVVAVVVTVGLEVRVDEVRMLLLLLLLLLVMVMALMMMVVVGKMRRHMVMHRMLLLLRLLLKITQQIHVREKVIACNAAAAVVAATSVIAAAAAAADGAISEGIVVEAGRGATVHEAVVVARCVRMHLPYSHHSARFPHA